MEHPTHCIPYFISIVTDITMCRFYCFDKSYQPNDYAKACEPPNGRVCVDFKKTIYFKSIL